MNKIDKLYEKHVKKEDFKELSDSDYVRIRQQVKALAAKLKAEGESKQMVTNMFTQVVYEVFR